MGIISEKQVTLDNGLTATTNVYSSYGSSSITMSKGTRSRRKQCILVFGNIDFMDKS